jgi:signal transduction histidine kinase
MTVLSLRTRLLAWASATSAFSLILVIVLVDVTFRANIREQLQASLGFARQVAEATRAGQIDARIAESVNIAEDTRLRAAVATGDPATVTQTLAEVFAQTSRGWTAVVAPDGTVLASTPGFPADQMDNAADLIAEARLGYDTGDVWIVAGDPVDVSASPIFFGSETLAVLVLGQPARTADVSAIEAAVGRPVFAVFGGLAIPGREASTLPEEGAEALMSWQTTDDDAIELLQLDGMQYFAAAAPILSRSERRIGSLILLGSYDQALRPSNNLRVALIAILVFGLVLAFTVSGALARAITVPVGRLLRETERLGRGDLEHPISPWRADEIGQLAEAFDEMRLSLRLARADLIRAERLGAIGKAASAVAHDFTQPLSAIAGAIGLLRMEGTPPEVRDRCFTAIEVELERLQRMKQEIVEFARGESALDEADVRIDSFLENTVSALRPQLAQRDVTLSVTHGYTGEWHIDSYRLARVIENLVRNAAAAISGRGSIQIRSMLEGDQLVFDLEDDGSGIPPERLEEIFEPFVSYGKKEGTGLGLAIARNVVQQHKGSITVRSSPEGTCFTVKLPRRGDSSVGEGTP